MTEMHNNWFRIIFISLILFAALMQTNLARGQEIPRDKEFKVIDERSVNLHDLQYMPTFSDISIGSGEFPSKLELRREFKQVPYFPIYFPDSSLSSPFAAHSSHNFLLFANCFPCDMGWSQGGYSGSSQPAHIMTVKAFDGVHSFTSQPAYWGAARAWANRYGDGAALSDDGDHVVLTTKAGDRITFSHTEPNGTGLGCGGACSVALYAEFASGETISFTYEKLEFPPSSSSVFWYPAIIPTAWSASRLTSVANARGYGFNIEYVNPSLTAGVARTRTLISKISGFRTGCSDAAVICESGTLPQALYNYSLVGTEATTGNKAYRLTSFQNSRSDTFKYDYDPAREFRLSKIYIPNSETEIDRYITYYNDNANIPYGYFTGRVSSIQDAAGNVTSYSGGYWGAAVADTSPTTTTVNAANGGVTSLHFAGRRTLKFPVPDLITLPTGSQLKFSYDNNFRLLSYTDAGGIREDYTLDGRGNISQVTRTPKLGSTEVVTTESWFFPSCTSINFRICNRPQYYVDERSKQTDYSYSSANGGLEVTLAPANDNGIRAVNRISYSGFYPAPGFSLPAGATLSLAYLPTAIDTCRTSTVTGTTVDFSFVCPTADRIRKENIYSSSTVAARTNYELQGVIEDADGVRALTCYRYDVVGNRIAETRPLGAALTCN